LGDKEVFSFGMRDYRSGEGQNFEKNSVIRERPFKLVESTHMQLNAKSLARSSLFSTDAFATAYLRSINRKLHHQFSGDIL